MIFTLIFYAYALFGAPWFRDNLLGAFKTEETSLFPGLILIFALVAETIALRGTVTAAPFLKVPGSTTSSIRSTGPGSCSAAAAAA